MPLAVQYYNGTEWQQFGLTTADVTLSDGSIASSFYSIKDSNDTLYVLCGRTTDSPRKAKIIKIPKTGIYTIRNMVNFDTGAENTGNWAANNIQHDMAISRDGLYLFVTTSTNNADNQCIHKIPISALTGGDMANYRWSIDYNANIKFAIYQDRYIWVASGTTIKIYDYTTKAELASVVSTNTTAAISCDMQGNLYGIEQYFDNEFRAKITKHIFNGISTITSSAITGGISIYHYEKQLLIDKWGDLIILTNSGTGSTLMKYTSTGVQVGTTLALQAPMYNLNVDKDGAILYSNDLGTYKIPKNTQGQQALVLGTKIRDTGMTTYGNRMFLDNAIMG